MTTRITLPAFPHTLLGFDNLFAQFEKEMNRASGTYNYPPHNVIAGHDGTIKIEIAVAGFKENELSVTVKNEELIVAGMKEAEERMSEEEEKKLDPGIRRSLARDENGAAYPFSGSKFNSAGKYLHRGLALRDFELKFILGDVIKVSDVSLADGILTINLEKIVPEEHKPKKLKINTK